MLSDNPTFILVDASYNRKGFTCLDVFRALNVLVLTVQLVFSIYCIFEMGSTGALLVLLPNLVVAIWSILYQSCDNIASSRVFKIQAYAVSWASILLTLLAAYSAINGPSPYGVFIILYLSTLGWTSSLLGFTLIVILILEEEKERMNKRQLMVNQQLMPECYYIPSPSKLMV